MQGQAFGTGPKRWIPSNQALRNSQGQPLANSLGAGSNRFMGSLTSRKFTVPELPRDYRQHGIYLHVRLAGSQPEEPAAAKPFLLEPEPDCGRGQKARTSFRRAADCSGNLPDDHSGGFESAISRFWTAAPAGISPWTRSSFPTPGSLPFTWTPPPGTAAKDRLGEPSSLQSLARTYRELFPGGPERRGFADSGPPLAAGLPQSDRPPGRSGRSPVAGRAEIGGADAGATPGSGRPGATLPIRHVQPGQGSAERAGSPERGSQEPGPGGSPPLPADPGREGSAPILEGSGRLQLADRLVNPRNPLTARVMVNRIWKHHFGEGLVRLGGQLRQDGRPAQPSRAAGFSGPSLHEGGVVGQGHPAPDSAEQHLPDVRPE